ncbi:dentin sialophosphoprotein-like [Gossypium australe]|uniref:Dentin sialophosphoprotein-like n=1 Tax=Gossypium australe TaxID=47621 RepID=A0A5B6V698_9ROSI|nr:dentin sialophosphoprotein-like [Gossypium australe]
MDSKEILSIFSFLLLFLQSHARPANQKEESFGPSSPASAPGPSSPAPSNHGCWLSSTSCHNESLRACLDPASIGSKKVIVLVMNEGEKNLIVSVSTSHGKTKKVEVLPHLTKKVEITAKVGGNSTIQIDAGELRCAIQIGAAASSYGIFNYIPFPRHISPIYLLILTGLIIGSTYAFYKRSKRDDGIAYQQLEMGQPASSSPNNVDVETAQGWEQDWEGEWQEVKSKLASVNGLSSRSAKRDDD